MLVAAAVALPACTDRAGNEPSREQVNAAVDKTEAAAIAAAKKAAELAETARDKTVAFAKSPQVKQDAQNAKQALEHALDKNRRDNEPPPNEPPPKP
ncbi:MAG: hypothetical protein ABIQ82_04450 [Variovorax sp.]